MLQKHKRHLGLVPRIILGIVIGILIGQMPFITEPIIRGLVTLSTMFSTFLSFIIPLMIIGFVVKGIAELAEGAGKLLGLTAIISYLSGTIAGLFTFAVVMNLFPYFITTDIQQKIVGVGEGVEPFFTLPLEPMLDVTAALVFSFMMGLGISVLRRNNRGEVLFEAFDDFGNIIVKVLDTMIVPLMPFYIGINFASMSYSGTVFTILSVFWKVLIIGILLQTIYVTALFIVMGLYGGKNPFVLLKNQIPGYLVSLGTQSSAAAIPTNIECAKKNGVSETIRQFVIPLCSTIHLSGSIITITTNATAVLLLFDIPIDNGVMLAFVFTLGMGMVAAPGAPGGAIMSALPFLPMVGITTDAMQQLMISLHIAQDSFGTAANVSGDNAIAVAVDRVYEKYIKPKENQTKATTVEE